MYFKNTHSNEKTGDNTQEDLSEDGLVPTDTRVFKCEYCGKDYGQGEIAQQNLQRHIQSNHLRKYLFFITY